MKLNFVAIKNEIHLLGHILGMNDTHPDESAIQSLKDNKLYCWFDQDKVIWRLDRIKSRFTQLCALRASSRGKLHFSPTTNLAEARWILGVPCLINAEIRLRASEIKSPLSSQPFPTIITVNVTDMQDGQDQACVYHYTPITLEIQNKWVEPLIAEFQLHEAAEVTA